MIAIPKAEDLVKSIEATEKSRDEKAFIEIIKKLEECKKTLLRHIFWKGVLSEWAIKELRKAGYRVFDDSYFGRYCISF